MAANGRQRALPLVLDPHLLMMCLLCQRQVGRYNDILAPPHPCLVLLKQSSGSNFQRFIKKTGLALVMDEEKANGTSEWKPIYNL